MHEWLGSAGRDLALCAAALDLTLVSYEGASFHAQQAAEKALKALLVWHQVEFPRTHSIGDLLTLLEPSRPGISEQLDSARALTSYAARGRYPGEGPMPDRREAAGHLEMAQLVAQEVERILVPLLRTEGTDAS